MLTTGMTAEYGKTQERCVIEAIDRGRAYVEFEDGRKEWVNKRMLAWSPSEAEIAERAAEIRRANEEILPPTQAEWDFAKDDWGGGGA